MAIKNPVSNRNLRGLFLDGLNWHFSEKRWRDTEEGTTLKFEILKDNRIWVNGYPTEVYFYEDETTPNKPIIEALEKMEAFLKKSI